MSVESKKISIPTVDVKLSDGSNYPRWAKAIRIYADLLDVEHFYDSSNLQSSSDSEAKVWKKSNNLATALLEHNTEGAARDIVLDAASAAEAWTNLRSQYEGKDRTSLYALYSNINTTKFDDRSLTVDDHISDFNGRWSKLAATVGGETDLKTAAGVFCALTKCDEAKAIILLASFPEYYKLTISSIAAQKENISFSHVTSQLRNLITTRKPGGTRSENDSTKHYSRLASPTAFASTSRRGGVPICGYCKTKYNWSGRGHHESQCHRKFQDQKGKNEANSAQPDENHHEAGDLFAFSTNSSKSTNQNFNKWEWDTAASVHLTPHKFLLQSPSSDSTEILTAGGTFVSAELKGSVTISQGKRNLVLRDVYYVPQTPHNLLSGIKMKLLGIHLNTKTTPETIEIPSQADMEAYNENGKTIVYSDSSKCRAVMSNDAETTQSAMDFHERYGHLPFPAFRRIPEAPTWLANVKIQCDACIKGKSTKPPSPPARFHRRKSEVLALVHSDLQELQTTGYNKAKYNCVLVDDASSFTMTKAVTSKDLAAQAVLDMMASMEVVTGRQIKAIKTDNGGEYRSGRFLQELSRRGVVLIESVPYHSETNPVAERTHRTLVTMVRTAIAATGLPKSYWPEAFPHAAFTKNRIPHAALEGKSPVEVFLPGIDIHKERSRFRSFGEPVWIHSYVETNKLEPRAEKARIIGYCPSFKTYRVLTESRKVTTAQSPIHREIYGPGTSSKRGPSDLEIDVSEPLGPLNTDPHPFTPREEKQTTPELEDVFPSKPESPDPFEKGHWTAPGAFEDSPPLRRTTRSTAGKPPVKFGYSTQALNVSLHLADITVPESEAMHGPEKHHWMEAKLKEMDQLKTYEVYKEIDTLPTGHPTVDTKWVFRRKINPDGSVKYKARLTGRGFTQIPHIHFDKTEAPTVKVDTWRLITTLSLSQEWILHQYDVIAAYLQAPLKHEVYIHDPKITGNKVWKLQKALYGLKQSAHEWNKEITGMICQTGLTQCINDPAAFYNKHIIVAIHVDDFLIAAESAEHEKGFIDSLSLAGLEFEHRGRPQRFLGTIWTWIEVNKMDAVLISSQNTIWMLEEEHQGKYQPGATTPMTTDFHTLAQSPEYQHRDEFGSTNNLTDPTKYQSLIGSLLYIGRMTRPDILFAVTTLARHCSKPAAIHWKAALRVVSYLSRTAEVGIVLAGQDKSQQKITVVTDASYAPTGGRSHTGTTLMFGCSHISWTSKQQELVTLSSAEAEYVAITSGAQDALWTLAILKEFGHPDTHIVPQLITDSESARKLAYRAGYTPRTRHIAVRFNFLKEQLSQGELTLEWQRGNENLADMLTKALAGPALQKSIERWGMTMPKSRYIKGECKKLSQT